MLGITKKEMFRYAALPGFKPRIQELITSGFHYIPFFVALVYQAVRLLPAYHPYANSENIGRFGLRNVIAEAANNLVMSRKNIDQILLFFVVLLGLAIIFVQLSLLGFSLFIQPVMAATMPNTIAGFFVTNSTNAPQDLAYIMMDLVFGVPGIFNSCVAAGGDCLLDVDAALGTNDGIDPWVGAGLSWPFPIHNALHQMFQTYSFGLLVVAAFITTYFIITILAETAQTGTAFGKRFNKVWAPVRIVVAFGLLMPVGHGLNSSQYIVLYAAKYGSGFASNGWALFNQELTTSYLGNQTTLVTRPNAPDVTTLLQFLFSASVCYELEMVTYKYEVEPYLVGDPLATTDHLSLNGLARVPFESSYRQMLDFANGAHQVTIRFGKHDPKNVREKGHVDPVCGEITMSLIDPREASAEPAADMIQRYYWYIINELWYAVFYGKNDDLEEVYGIPAENYPLGIACQYYKNSCSAPVGMPDKNYRDILKLFYKDDLDAMMDGEEKMVAQGLTRIANDPNALGIVEAQAASPKWVNGQATLEQKGWAGAGIWYNKVAELNGTVSAAINKAPRVSLWPKVMEYVLAEKAKHAQTLDLDTRFKPELPEGKKLHYGRPNDQQHAQALWEGFEYWQNNPEASGNVLIDTIHAVLGTEGLYSMRKNTDVHPLAQLVGIGRSFVNSAIGNIADAATLSLLAALIGGSEGTAAIVGLIMTIVMISLTIGFILFYVVPFLPFIYFFFAVGGWIKGIFEAMVGAPLWALAHIRIDGNGLAGKDAVSGYFLIFEIFLRPILIVFGMLASISIFSALVSVMNQTWDIVMSNLGGYDMEAASQPAAVGASLVDQMRGPVDQFFYTAVYAVVVYLMAMSSFKLIDLIPNNILRWMGSSVSTFNDQAADPAQGLVGTATIGSQQTLSQIGGGAQGIMTGAAGGKFL